MLKKLRAHFLYLGILSALKKETNKGFVWVALLGSDKLSVLMPECVKRILSAVMRSYLLGHFSPHEQSGISVEKEFFQSGGGGLKSDRNTKESGSFLQLDFIRNKRDKIRLT